MKIKKENNNSSDKFNKRKEYLLALLILFVVCEIMFQINNRVIQSLGICILPIIVAYSILLIRNEQNNI